MDLQLKTNQENEKLLQAHGRMIENIHLGTNHLQEYSRSKGSANTNDSDSQPTGITSDTPSDMVRDRTKVKL